MISIPLFESLRDTTLRALGVSAVKRLRLYTLVPALLDKSFQNLSKIFLHLPKFPVISQLRTNFAEMPRNRLPPSRVEHQGRRGGESESLEEEAIEIGNGHRYHQPFAA
jgi:hypothetical protein